MARYAFAGLEARQRLLEGFLLRLASSTDADAFILRGGMLVHHWIPTVGRVVGDVDLVCGLPFHVDDMRKCLGAILANREPSDGVSFDAERFRLDAMWEGSPQPGLRLFAAGEVDGRPSEIQVDLTFNLELWPAAVRGPLSTRFGTVHVWMSQPQTVLGTKLRVLAELGPKHWRPKDLGDIWLMRRRFSEGSPTVLAEAIERALRRDSIQTR